MDNTWASLVFVMKPRHRGGEASEGAQHPKSITEKKLSKSICYTTTQCTSLRSLYLRRICYFSLSGFLRHATTSTALRSPIARSRRATQTQTLARVVPTTKAAGPIYACLRAFATHKTATTEASSTRTAAPTSQGCLQIARISVPMVRC